MLFGIWSVPVLIGAVVVYSRQLESGAPVSWTYALLCGAPFWYGWAILTPGVLYLGARFPFEEANPWLSAGLHAAASISIGPLHLLVSLASVRAIFPESTEADFLQVYPSALGAYLEFEFLLYWAVLGAGYLIDYRKRAQAGALRTAQLEAQLAQAHLKALKVQLQPHFLFNTLHAVSSLMEEDLEQARRMLVRLGDLLRLTLETQGIQEVPLRQELECMELYLDIERVRFPDRLHLEMIVEPEALEAMVPNLLLQPLVENAVRYGISPRDTGGVITITARCEDERLLLRVSDDGVDETGDSRERPTGTGVGLANVRSRLMELYGHDHDFQILRPDPGGFCVEIVIPHRSAREAVAL